jgi:hypothetical protein
VNLTIKKIISEFGIFGLIRLPLIFASIKIHNIKIRLYRKDASKLNRDIKKIKELTIKDFQLFPNKKGEDYKKVLKWSIKNAKKKTIYSLVKEYYGSLPFSKRILRFITI